MIHFEHSTPGLQHNLSQLVRSQDLAGLAKCVAFGIDLNGCFEDLYRGNQCGTLVAHAVQQVRGNRIFGRMRTDHTNGLDTAVLEWLLQSGADPDVPAVYIVHSGIYPFGLRVTPLHIACGFPGNGSFPESGILADVVDMLLEHGADPHAQASPGMLKYDDPHHDIDFLNSYDAADLDDLDFQGRIRHPALIAIGEIRAQLSESMPKVPHTLQCTPNDIYTSECRCGLRWRARRHLFLILFRGDLSKLLQKVLQTADLLQIIAQFL